MIDEVAALLATGKFRDRARRLVRGNLADADDLVHDTFIKAVTTEIPPRSHIAGWLMRVMWSVNINRWRRGAGKRGEYLYDNPFVGLEALGDQPDDSLSPEQEYDLEHLSFGAARHYLKNSPLSS